MRTEVKNRYKIKDMGAVEQFTASGSFSGKFFVQVIC